MIKLTLTLMPDVLGICKLDPSAGIPVRAVSGNFISITKTESELSIVCRENIIPAEIMSEKNWRAFKIEGPLDFALTGILASLLTPLANAGIPIFAVSTYDTDYVLVKAEHQEKAVLALSSDFNINR